MRIVFCGTASFAVPALEACAEVGEVVMVVTQPDKPGDRGRRAERPVAARALELGLPVSQPGTLRSEEMHAQFEAWNPTVLAVAAYGKIIPGSLLALPPWGGINVHGSLLPRWRGAAPVQAAILAGDEVTGVTIMRMDAGMDTGDILVQKECPVGDATTPELMERLAGMGGALLGSVLRMYEQGTPPAPRKQDEENATYTKKIERSDGEIRWDHDSAVDIVRRIRAFTPWPGVVTALAGRRVEIEMAHVATGMTHEATGGAILGRTREWGFLACAGGDVLAVERVRPEGKKSMDFAAFCNGVAELKSVPKITVPITERSQS